MNRLFLACATAASLCFTLATPLHAAASSTSSTTKMAPQISNMSREEVLAYHVKLEKDLDTKAYQHIKDRDRETINASQSHIRSILDKVTTLEQLSEDQRLAVFNEHEKIGALLNSRESERLVCEKVYKTGSHRPEVQCQTVAQRDSDRQAAQKAMLDTSKQAHSRPSN